ncbi:hypothetical protein RUM43_012549 [Polyplax serrata]|uniref:Uncharacterized protein n=1 Tax=Polyplax serrata TaxID=468196 RepID=A0AAN8S3B7_POLSC
MALNTQLSAAAASVGSACLLAVLTNFQFSFPVGKRLIFAEKVTEFDWLVGHLLLRFSHEVKVGHRGRCNGNRRGGSGGEEEIGSCGGLLGDVIEKAIRKDVTGMNDGGSGDYEDHIEE